MYVITTCSLGIGGNKPLPGLEKQELFENCELERQGELNSHI